MSRYEPLTRYLQGCGSSDITLSFNDLEGIIGRSLPASAREHQAWWANTTTHSHALSWMRAEWKTCNVNLLRRTVRFVRPRAAVAALAEPGAPAADLVIERQRLSGAAVRLLQDYCETHGCEMGEALVGVLNELALERRRQLIDWVRANAPRVPGDSTDIIREARDAR